MQRICKWIKFCHIKTSCMFDQMVDQHASDLVGWHCFTYLWSSVFRKYDRKWKSKHDLWLSMTVYDCLWCMPWKLCLNAQICGTKTTNFCKARLNCLEWNSSAWNKHLHSCPEGAIVIVFYIWNSKQIFVKPIKFENGFCFWTRTFSSCPMLQMCSKQICV